MTEVFIPTRARPHLIEKTAHHWRNQKNVNVTLVIEPTAEENEAYRNSGFPLLVLEDADMGMGYIRDQILEEAMRRDLDAFVMCDDDAYPERGNVERLCETVWEKDVVGCGASSSYHGLMIGNQVLELKTRFPIAGGYGHIMFAINTRNAWSLGGYPWWATAWGEDTEIQRQGIFEGMPWWYDTRVRLKSVAKRYSPGGLSDHYPDKKREREERKCHEIIFERWPDYISDPKSGRFRCAWKKMMQDYCPGWERKVPKAAREALGSKS